jgi:hypothetical protein
LYKSRVREGDSEMWQNPKGEWRPGERESERELGCVVVSCGAKEKRGRNMGVNLVPVIG